MLEPLWDPRLSHLVTQISQLSRWQIFLQQGLGGSLFFYLSRCLLENPASSIIMQHDRMQWLIKRLKMFGVLVYRQGFWMAHYSHPNFKLTKLWSTSSAIWKLDFGKLTPDMKRKHSSNTTKRYINSKGERRWTATRNLKKSQRLRCNSKPFTL